VGVRQGVNKITGISIGIFVFTKQLTKSMAFLRRKAVLSFTTKFQLPHEGMEQLEYLSRYVALWKHMLLLSCTDFMFFLFL
jgi:hypothetical protein